MASIDDIMSLLQTKGCSECGRANISQLDHALQSAHLAQSDNAPPGLVVAAAATTWAIYWETAPNPHEETGHAWVSPTLPSGGPVSLYACM